MEIIFAFYLTLLVFAIILSRTLYLARILAYEKPALG